MRLSLLVGSVLGGGFGLLALAACANETSIDPFFGDASSSSSSSSSSSGGEGDGGSSGGEGDGGSSGLAPASLKPGNVIAVGVAADDVIYVLNNGGARVLEAIPIAGGASTKIADLGANDAYLVRGGAVAVYTNIANSQATISLWSRAAGFKADVGTASAAGLFAASPDGTRVAFSVATNMANTSTSLAISDLGAGAVSAAPVLTGATTNAGAAINLAAAQDQGANPAACPLDIAFVGKTLVAAYCTGTAAGTATARLVIVAGTNPPTADRIDNGAGANNAAATILPSWLPDEAGTKFFVTTPAGLGRIITATGTVTDLEADTNAGFMTPDGSAAIYVTGAGALKKHTGAGAPTTLVATGVLGLLSSSPDGKYVAYLTQEDAQSGLHDIRAVNHTIAPAVIDYVATPTAGLIGFNATSTDIVYLDEGAATGFKLKSKPIAGGAEKVIGDGVASAELARSGTSAIIYTNPDLTALEQQDILIADISAVNTTAAGSPQKLADQIPDPLVRFKDKTLIYATVPGAPMGGLFKVALP